MVRGIDIIRRCAMNLNIRRYGQVKLKSFVHDVSEFGRASNRLRFQLVKLVIDLSFMMFSYNVASHVICPSWFLGS